MGLIWDTGFGCIDFGGSGTEGKVEEVPISMLSLAPEFSNATTGSGSSTEYSTFFFTQGAVVTGEQAPIRTQTDRDILALEEAMAVDLHYIYHPVGLKYAVSTVNPNRTVLETVASWSKVYETKNIGIVRATNVSNQD